MAVVAAAVVVLALVLVADRRQGPLAVAQEASCLGEDVPEDRASAAVEAVRMLLHLAWLDADDDAGGVDRCVARGVELPSALSDPRGPSAHVFTRPPALETDPETGARVGRVIAEIDGRYHAFTVSVDGPPTIVAIDELTPQLTYADAQATLEAYVRGLPVASSRGIR